MYDLDLLPPFISPLTDEQHARLGRIAVLWGHIDFFVDEILLKVLRLTRTQKAALIGEKPIGPKLELLKPAIKGVKDDASREKVQALYDLLNSTKTERNHIFHGAWGWRAHDRAKTVTVAARHPKTPHSPVEADRLPKIEKDLCRAARQAADAYALLEKRQPDPRSGRYVHGRPKRPHKWFLRWLEQRPLDDASLDRSYTVGELPRLNKPLG